MHMFLLQKASGKKHRCYAHTPQLSPSDKVRCNPAISFLRKSSNWLTKFNKRCALRYISCSLPCNFSSVISFIILSIGDIISVSGVRNSWLTFVKKRNFIWLNSSLFFASSSIWRILNLLRSSVVRHKVKRKQLLLSEEHKRYMPTESSRKAEE